MKQASSFDLHDIIESVLDGEPTARIEQRFGLRPRTARYAVARAGFTLTELRRMPLSRVRTQREVAALFGVLVSRVQGWLAARAIKVKRRQPYPAARRRTRRGRPLGNRTRVHITDQVLSGFIADRAWWMTWDPARITDPEWRAEALRLREAAGGCWVTTQELSEALHYDARTIRGWITSGRWPVEVMRREGRWYVWKPAGGIVPVPLAMAGISPVPTGWRPGAVVKRCAACGQLWEAVTRQEKVRTTCSDACARAARLVRRPRVFRRYPVVKHCAVCARAFPVWDAEGARRKQSCSAPACVRALQGRHGQVGHEARRAA